MHVTRRTLLVVAVGSAALAGGCSGAPLPIIGARDPDDDARTANAQSERALIEACRSLAKKAPGSTAAALDALARQHEDHLAAIAPGGSGASASGTASAAPATIAGLRKLEAQAARQRTDAAVAAADPQFAALLASIAASESSHVAYLAGVRS